MIKKEIDINVGPPTGLKKESDIASVLVSSLKEDGYDVYQEVYINGRVLDIFATKNGLNYAIECKQSIGLEVMEQAYYWKDYVNYTYLYCPYPKYKNLYSSDRKLYIAEEIARKLGFGIIFVRERQFYRNKSYEVYTHTESPFNEDPPYKNKIALFEEQKNFASAGTKNGYFTPFKKTIFNLEEYVKNNPGVYLNEAVLNIEHHYSSKNSAVGALKDLLVKNKVSKNLYTLYDEKNKIKLFYKI